MATLYATSVSAATDAINYVQPEIIVIIVACLLLVDGAFRTNRTITAPLTVLVLIYGLVRWYFPPVVETGILETSLFRNDLLVSYARGIGYFGGLVLALLSWHKIDDRQSAEYFACLLFITVGTILVAAANDLVTLFLALELISIPTYVLLYLPRHDVAAQEASMKYFLLSIFASGLLLFGFSLLYGITGTTNLELMRSLLRTGDPGGMTTLLGVAMVLIVAGLGFRITAVPFHFYAPDVYQGAPTLGAALLAFIPKIAGFVGLYQVISATILVTGIDLRAPVFLGQASGLIWILALVSMTMGNLIGLLQDNLKRLLAYSSIAHTGYVLVGFGAGVSANTAVNGNDALFFYLVIYGAMTLGAFAVISHLSRSDRPIENIDDLAGLGRTHPFLALAMATFLFSLTGLPPTAGFWGKLNVFLAAWGTGSRLYQILAVVMAINAAIGGWYYLRVVAAMYLRQPIKPLDPPRNVPSYVALALCFALTLGLFFFPNRLWQMVDQLTPAPVQERTIVLSVGP